MNTFVTIKSTNNYDEINNAIKSVIDDIGLNFSKVFSTGSIIREEHNESIKSSIHIDIIGNVVIGILFLQNNECLL